MASRAANPALLSASALTIDMRPWMRGFFIGGTEALCIISSPTTCSKALVLARTSPAKREGSVRQTLMEEIRLSFFRIWSKRKFLNQSEGESLKFVVIG